MIQNSKLYVTLNGSGSFALTVKLWTRSSCYRASVPVVGATSQKLREIKAVFSSIRSNFTGLNEEDWLSFDSLLEQMNTMSTPLDPALTLALSLASARAATNNELWKLMGPANKFPHIAGIAVKGSVWNEFLLIPHKEKTVMGAFRMLIEAWKVIGHELKEKGVLSGRSHTGAWISDLGDTETLYLLHQVAKDWNMGIGLNIGASSIWDGNNYDYTKSNDGVINKKLTPDEQMSFMSAIMEHYRIDYIEDPFKKDDFMQHSELNHKFDTMIAGGDLYSADAGRIKASYKFRPTNTITIDPKNLRTVSQLREISEFTRHRSIKLALSRFNSETGDDWLSDLSVAFGVDMIKLGVTGAANTSKFSRLMEIWEEAQDPKLGRNF